MLNSAKTRVNYESGIIYKLCCKDPTITECYIGSTTNFTNRKRGHKCACNRGDNRYVYQFIRDKGGFENWDMIQIEEYKATSKKDLESRERYWIEHLKSELNKHIPTRTFKEWEKDNIERLSIYRKDYHQANKEHKNTYNREYREANKETIAVKEKQYYEINKEKVLARNKEYREENKEAVALKGKQYYETNKEKVLARNKEYRDKNKETISSHNKKYYEENRETIALQNKKYREANKETIALKKRESISCDICGMTYTKPNKSRHEKSKKHMEAL